MERAWPSTARPRSPVAGFCRWRRWRPPLFYDPVMNRAIMVISASATLALSGVAAASVTQAEPPPPGTPCSFTLSSPQVVGDTVTATLAPAGCFAPFRPHISVVCVQRADTPAQCSQARNDDTAVVSVPYVPGATYTATGRGLGAVFNDASGPNWKLEGPIAAVL